MKIQTIAYCSSTTSACILLQLIYPTLFNPQRMCQKVIIAIFSVNLSSSDLAIASF